MESRCLAVGYYGPDPKVRVVNQSVFLVEVVVGPNGTKCLKICEGLQEELGVG